jgi:membrane-associated protein
MDPSTLAVFLQQWGYPAFFLLLCITAFGFPIPEDLLLLSGGYLISADVFSWAIALPIAIGGVITSDFILYTFGRRMAQHAASRPPGRLVATARLQRFAGWFDRVGAGAVFLARLVPGTRAVVFISAGLRGVPPRIFVLYDAAGALLWTPLMVWLGTVLGGRIGSLAHLIDGVARFAFWIVVIAVALLVLHRYWRTEESKL